MGGAAGGGSAARTIEMASSRAIDRVKTAGQGFDGLDFPVISSTTELFIAPAVRKNAPSSNSFFRTRLPSSSIYSASVRSMINALRSRIEEAVFQDCSNSLAQAPISL